MMVEEEKCVRLQKLMAQAGIGSRRACEKLIAEGRVTVNGDLITVPGTLASSSDRIEVDGVPAVIESEKVYIVLNKPVGYITSAKDQFGRKTVLDILAAEVPVRVFPVGRLDYHTSGLLLLTNDGEFANLATHPGHEIRKVYEVLTPDIPGAAAIQQLREGVILDDSFHTAPAEVFFKEGEICGSNDGAASSIGSGSIVSGVVSGTSGSIGETSARPMYRVTLVIHEGKNRQVRRMFDAVGLRVMGLKRVAIGALTLGDLPVGAWRYISYQDAMKIQEKNTERVENS